MGGDVGVNGGGGCLVTLMVWGVGGLAGGR